MSFLCVSFCFQMYFSASLYFSSSFLVVSFYFILKRDLHGKLKYETSKTKRAKTFLKDP